MAPRAASPGIKAEDAMSLDEGGDEARHPRRHPTTTTSPSPKLQAPPVRKREGEQAEDEEGEGEGEDEDFVQVQNAATRVWLVKIPNFVAERWATITAPNVPLGAVRVHHEPPGPAAKYPKVTLHLPTDQAWCADLPKHYQLAFTNTPVSRASTASGTGAGGSSIPSNKQSFVFTERTGPPGSGGRRRGAQEIAGKIEYEATMQPVQDADYRNIMKRRTQQATMPTRVVQRMEVEEQKRTDMLKLRPGSNQAALGMATFAPAATAARLTKQVSAASAAATERKERMPRSELLDMLFLLFERYTYWSMKSLMEATKQPAVWLREVLQEVCILNKRGPYVGTYQLKPEFKAKEPASASDTGVGGEGEGNTKDEGMEGQEGVSGDATMADG